MPYIGERLIRMIIPRHMLFPLILLALEFCCTVYFFAINLPMLQLAMCSAGLAILPSTAGKTLQEAKKNVKGTQKTFLLRQKYGCRLCAYMLLANLGSTTKKDTDALIPRFLHATVGVFPSLRQYWGMYVRPPKPLQMCGIEWHVIGRLNGEASTGSIDLLQWLQLGK